MIELEIKRKKLYLDNITLSVNRTQCLGNLSLTNHDNIPANIEVRAEGKIKYYQNKICDESNRNFAISKKEEFILLRDSALDDMHLSSSLKIIIMPNETRDLSVFSSGIDKTNDLIKKYLLDNNKELRQIWEKRWWGKLATLFGFFKIFNRIEIGWFNGSITITKEQKITQKIPIKIKLLYQN